MTFPVWHGQGRERDLGRGLDADITSSIEAAWWGITSTFGNSTMHTKSLFSKTGKGLLEMKYRSHRLPEEAFRVLCLIDGRTTFGELVDKSRIAEIALGNVLTALANDGYIKDLIRLAAGSDVPNCAALPVICEGTEALSSAQGTVAPTAPARECERVRSTNVADR